MKLFPPYPMSYIFQLSYLVFCPSSINYTIHLHTSLIKNYHQYQNHVSACTHPKFLIDSTEPRLLVPSSVLSSLSLSSFSSIRISLAAEFVILESDGLRNALFCFGCGLGPGFTVGARTSQGESKDWKCQFQK